mmetsp:Transcript_33403/g.90440  ORF Transcript_33403/g.90440 Transcript_33403/m.90440 type:complete len:351 (+) Transcript_33403:95-1147(+)
MWPAPWLSEHRGHCSGGGRDRSAGLVRRAYLMPRLALRGLLGPLANGPRVRAHEEVYALEEVAALWSVGVHRVDGGDDVGQAQGLRSILTPLRSDDREQLPTRASAIREDPVLRDLTDGIAGHLAVRLRAVACSLLVGIDPQAGVAIPIAPFGSVRPLERRRGGVRQPQICRCILADSQAQDGVQAERGARATLEELEARRALQCRCGCRGRARDVAPGARTAEAALHVHDVSGAAMGPPGAARLPIVVDLWRVCKGACPCCPPGARAAAKFTPRRSHGGLQRLVDDTPDTWRHALCRSIGANEEPLVIRAHLAWSTATGLETHIQRLAPEVLLQGLVRQLHDDVAAPFA